MTFPGSNCDQDARHALEQVIDAQVSMVWHTESELGAVDAVVLPGGFSYGDYLRGGAMAALSPITAAVRAFAHGGGPVLGICNGFQILTECGLLPGQLARNDVLHFVCRSVNLRVERSDLAWTNHFRRGEVLEMGIAHNEGRYYLDPEGLERLEAEDRVVFRYCDIAGRATADANPNGSAANIAGIVDARGTVLGMMPHPERAVEPLLGSSDGRGLFASLLASVVEGAT